MLNISVVSFSERLLPPLPLPFASLSPMFHRWLVTTRCDGLTHIGLSHLWATTAPAGSPPQTQAITNRYVLAHFPLNRDTGLGTPQQNLLAPVHSRHPDSLRTALRPILDAHSRRSEADITIALPEFGPPLLGQSITSPTSVSVPLPSVHASPRSRPR